MSAILNSSRLTLGTAQFGLNYGIANNAGQVHVSDAAAILDYAASKGLDTLDTAIAYGDSEARLGEIGIKRWQIVSKLPQLPDLTFDVRGWVRSSVMGSLERLKVSSLGALLLHQPADLLGTQGDALYAAMVELKTEGVVKKIGISIYGPDLLDSLLDHLAFDIVQAPFNILDHRMIDSGWLGRLHHMGVEIHVRSAFMQGLLLMPSTSRPTAFKLWQPLWNEWERWLIDHQLTPVEACLRYALSFNQIKRVIVGVDTQSQLKEIIESAAGNLPPIPAKLRSTDATLLNPSNWNKL